MKKLRLSQRITNRETKSFKKYLEEIREINQLTVDEEYELALIATNKNLTEREREDALLKLVEANLRFVISVAKQYVTQDNTLEDLVNEGNHGLIYAARRYDPKLGFKFITYAVWWVRKYILTYINNYARLIRLPNNKISIFNKLKEEISAIEQLLERTPTFNDIVAYTRDYDEHDIRLFLQSDKENSYSFDKPVEEEDSQSLMSDLYEDDTFGSADQYLNNDDSDYNLNKLLGSLKRDVDRKALIMLLGLDGKEPLSRKEVAEKLGVSCERVRQIRKDSLNFLKIKLSQKEFF